MKKWLAIGIPLLLLGLLVAWRFSSKKAQEAQATQQMGQRRGMAANVEVAKASPAVLVETLDAVGTAESPYRVLISPKTTGRIEALTVREGDRVKAGQVLVRMDPAELQAAVYQQEAGVAEARSRLAQAQLGRGPTEAGVSGAISQQRAAVASARTDLAQVRRNYDALVSSAESSVQDADARVASSAALVGNAKAQLGREQASLKNAQARLSRVENLYRQGFIAAQDVDDARTAVEVQRGAVEVASGQVTASESALRSAQAVRSSAQQQLGIARRKALADIEASKARLAQAEAALRLASANRAQTPAFAQNVAALTAAVRAAEAQLRQARARAAETALRSPIDGTVTARTADPGSLASPGQAVLTVQFLEWMYVTTSLPIERAADVTKGRQAEVRFDALPGRTFVGVVTNVNPAAELQSRQFAVRVRLSNVDQALRPGMFGRVSFVLRRIPAKVTVPREAVSKGPEGDTVAIVGSDQTAKVVPVRTGAQDEKRVEILSGVKPGDTVVVLSYQPVRDGQKVRLPGAPGQREGGSRQSVGRARP